jgi:biotin-[acetyl-CoA-carboxylase] ligase BirA-like protein
MQIFSYSEIDSTNLEAKRLIEMHSINGKAIIKAKNQTQGRGRLNRQWQFQQGNLAFSCVIPKSWQKSVPLPLCACIGIFNSLSQTKNIFFKWTNDLIILANNIPKKFAGILIEEFQEFIVIGIGINKKDFPINNTNFPATSLTQHGIEIATEEEIFENILPTLNFLPHEAIDFWNEKSFFTGKEVEISGKVGVFQGVDANFNAILQTANGNETIFFGDTLSVKQNH